MMMMMMMMMMRELMTLCDGRLDVFLVSNVLQQTFKPLRVQLLRCYAMLITLITSIDLVIKSRAATNNRQGARERQRYRR